MPDIQECPCIACDLERGVGKLIAISAVVLTVPHADANYAARVIATVLARRMASLLAAVGALDDVNVLVEEAVAEARKTATVAKASAEIGEPLGHA